MRSPSLYAMLRLSKTKSPQKLFSSDCIALYVIKSQIKLSKQLIAVQPSNKCFTEFKQLYFWAGRLRGDIIFFLLDKQICHS